MYQQFKTITMLFGPDCINTSEFTSDMCTGGISVDEAPLDKRSAAGN